MSFLGITKSDREQMLRATGMKSIDDLFLDIPQEIINENKIPDHKSMSEIEASSDLFKTAQKNRRYVSFAGAGSYNHYIPAVVDEISSRSEFYTAYTPYQAEVSQGTLTAIFEFQTMMCHLTGMDVANASMYDGATACAEAALMSFRKNKRKKILCAGTLHPSYSEVVKTYAWAGGLEVVDVPVKDGLVDEQALDFLTDEDVSALIIQTPNFFGCLEMVSLCAETIHSAGAHLIVAINEPVSMGLLEPPGKCGADIVCGEASAFGNPQGFGGPMLGFLSAKHVFTRLMPGRLAGESLDSDGNRAFILTLQTREQHIRREKATSNICSNEGLLLLRSAVYLSLIGNSLMELAEYNHNLASYLKKSLEQAGYRGPFKHSYFNEFTVYIDNFTQIEQQCINEGFLPGIHAGNFFPEMKDHVIFCVTEMNTKVEIDRFIDTVYSIRT